MLQAISSQDEETVQAGLVRLVETELLYQRGRPPRARYIFKHALLRDAAYASLLRSARQQVHQRIAQMLEERFPEAVETQPELVAHHLTEAALNEQAVDYWQKAGEKAIQYSAHVEAISHLNKGLELLKTLPETPERMQQELELLIPLGQALMVTKGQGAPEVEHVYALARERCQHVEETPQLFPVLGGLCGFYVMRGALQTARELGEQLLRLAQGQQNPTRLIDAHQALGSILFHFGELAPAYAHLEQAMALYGSQPPRSIATSGSDSRTVCLSFMAFILWFRGYPDQALESIHKALTLVQELSNPFGLAQTLCFTANIYQYCREGQAVQERAEAAITLSTEQEFPLWEAHGTIMLGWALAEQGQGEEGVAQIRQGLSIWQATGAVLVQPRILSLLAEAYGHVSQLDRSSPRNYVKIRA